MQVLPLLKQIQVRLIAHKQLMAAITHVDGRGIDLVTVAEMDAVEVTTEQHCH